MTSDALSASVGRVMTRAETAVEIAAMDELGWSPQTWHVLADLGYPWVSLPPECGGSGGTVSDVVEILVETGRHRLATPLADSGFVGGWLLASAGLEVSEDPVAVVPPASLSGLTVSTTARGMRLSGSLRSVPWASVATRILLVVDAGSVGRSSLVVLDRDRVDISPRRTLAGEPCDDVALDVAIGPDDLYDLALGVDVAALECRGALARAATTVGAMLRIREMTRDYARTREQFGLPIARFQAVAQSLAVMAEHVELARVAVLGAARDLTESPQDAASFAKITTGGAAAIVAPRAHQVHGAMGMTQEYDLHHFTRRLRVWTGQYGTTAEWSRRLGTRVLSNGSGPLWERLARTSPQLDR
jgi:acyl-CoA dehydrogenase